MHVDFNTVLTCSLSPHTTLYLSCVCMCPCNPLFIMCVHVSLQPSIYHVCACVPATLYLSCVCMRPCNPLSSHPLSSLCVSPSPTLTHLPFIVIIAGNPLDSSVFNQKMETVDTEYTSTERVQNPYKPQTYQQPVGGDRHTYIHTSCTYIHTYKTHCSVQVSLLCEYRPCLVM